MACDKPHPDLHGISGTTSEHKGIVEAAFRTMEYRLISQLPGFDAQFRLERKMTHQ